jgi:hypothetical protein
MQHRQLHVLARSGRLTCACDSIRRRPACWKLCHVAGAEVKDGGAPLQLRDVAAALRKQDDVNGVLKALGQAGPLVAAAPDELSAYAGARL